VYVKDSIIEDQIEKDLEKQCLKGRIKEVERQIRLRAKRKSRYFRLRERLKRLRGELELLFG